MEAPVAKITLGDGSAGVTLSDDLSGFVRDAIRRAGGAIGERLEQAADSVADEARAKWPVGRERRRPHSRDLFETELRVMSDGTVSAKVKNKADYVWTIRSKEKGSPWKEFVTKPAEAKADAIVAELGPELARLMGGR